MISEKSLKLTKSPAMDILKSSNIERVIFDLFGSSRTKELMEDLNKNNIFTMTQNETKELKKIF